MRFDYLSVMLVLAMACSGNGNGNPADALPEDISAPEDLLEDIFEFDVGEPTESCPNGTFSPGHGCFLPCEDGWLEGSDGMCHMECPAMSAPAEGGRCLVLACPEGWYPDGSAGGACIPSCPEGFEADEKWAGSGCRRTCPEDAVRGSDGWCHLGCPQGMAADVGSAGCLLEESGERAECPAGKWPVDAGDGISIYIDAASDSADPDGSQAKPFASLQEAVDHALATVDATTSVAFLLAAGEYLETVTIEGLEDVSVIGHCAEDVFVSGTGVGTLDNDWGLGAVSILGSKRAVVKGLTVSSDRKGIFLYSPSAHGPFAEVSENRIDGTLSTGIQVIGPFAEVIIADNTVIGATSYGIVAAEDKILPTVSPTSIAITGNRIEEMEDCNADFCTDILTSLGIVSLYAAKMEVSNNYVGNFSQAQGLLLAWSDDATISGNIMEDLIGSNGMTIDAHKATVSDNVIANCKVGPFSGNEAEPFFGIMGSTTLTYDQMDLTVVRNRIIDIQGFGAFVVSPNAPGTEITVQFVENELARSSAGLYFSSVADLTVTGNRFTAQRVPILQGSGASITVSDNVIRNGVTHTYDMPEDTIAGSVIEEPTAAVSLGTLDKEETLLFTGNHIHAMPNLAAGGLLGRALGFGGVYKARVDGNVFDENLAEALVAGSDYVDLQVAGNIFLGIDSEMNEGTPGGRGALILASELKEEDVTLTVKGNLFKDFMHKENGPNLTVIFQHDTARCEIVENQFFAVRQIVVDSSGAPPEELIFTGNRLWSSLLSLASFDKLTFADNHLSGFLAYFQQQEPSGATTIVGNYFLQGRVEVRLAAGTTDISGNEFDESLGFGLLVGSAVAAEVDSVTVTHNLFNKVWDTEWSVGPVGVIGDGLQVTGMAEAPCSGVRVEANRFHDCFRSGAVISGSTATVSGNMFAEGCPLVVQSEPVSGAVVGDDVVFALRPESPYGVVTIEDMTFME
jgi:nitrous oxidase accessory protein NosD